ncbi:MAG: CHAD domain-containing protein [Armatimonadota bacterium]|nr:CHAD domain-containing protein [Armatimonadota bacterium]MDW8291211.1 CHAD domain-containing protein [Armatimonadota bacterium]
MEKTALEPLERSVRDRTRTLRAQVKRCRKQFSEEAVHDLRVAMRRLLALLDYLAFLAPSPALRKARREVKSHLDAFDALRDTQVMLLETSQRLTELPEVEPLHRFLQKREKRLLRQAQKDISGIQDGYAKVLRGAVRAVAQKGGDILSPVDDAYQTVLHRLALVDPSDTATIHRVRIAFKRFRYSIEVAKPLLTTMPPELLERLHDYQTLMGEIQDMEVMLRTIDEFAARHSDCIMEPVRQHYRARHAEKVAAYLERMNEVYSFWRSAPERPLPWETVATAIPAASEPQEEGEPVAAIVSALPEGQAEEQLSVTEPEAGGNNQRESATVPASTHSEEGTA